MDPVDSFRVPIQLYFASVDDRTEVGRNLDMGVVLKEHFVFSRRMAVSRQRNLEQPPYTRYIVPSGLACISNHRPGSTKRHRAKLSGELPMAGPSLRLMAWLPYPSLGLVAQKVAPRVLGPLDGSKGQHMRRLKLEPHPVLQGARGSVGSTCAACRKGEATSIARRGKHRGW